MSLVNITHPDGSVTQIESNNTVVSHAVDEAGVYAGLAQAAPGITWVSGPPPTDEQGWRWAFAQNRWVRVVPLAEAKAVAARDIDTAAGAARLRFVTDVPGQQLVYLRKLDQARAYAAASYSGTAPPFIDAEASATGRTAQAVADDVIAAAAAWDDAKSPAIEGLRIKAKRAIGAAATAAQVHAARQAALGALAAV